MSDLVGNPNCWFCHAQAHLLFKTDCERDLAMAVLLYSVSWLQICALDGSKFHSNKASNRPAVENYTIHALLLFTIRGKITSSTLSSS